MCLIENKNPKIRLRQWQHIHELETYIADVQGISLSILGGEGRRVICRKNLWRRARKELWTVRLGKLMEAKTFLEGNFNPGGHHVFLINMTPSLKILIKLKGAILTEQDK